MLAHFVSVVLIITAFWGRGEGMKSCSWFKIINHSWGSAPVCTSRGSLWQGGAWEQERNLFYLWTVYMKFTVWITKTSFVSPHQCLADLFLISICGWYWAFQRFPVFIYYENLTMHLLQDFGIYIFFYFILALLFPWPLSDLPKMIIPMWDLEACARLNPCSYFFIPSLY